MILRINPNRMELIRLRRRLGLARRGHKLLQDKLEHMMQRFLGYIKEAKEWELRIRKSLEEIIPLFIIAQAKMSKEGFCEALNYVNTDLDFKLWEEKIMNVKTCRIQVNKIEMFLNYSLINSTAELDVALLKLKGLIPQLINFAQVLKICQILASEIERTRRRVNALEYILMPSLTETASYITQKLNEFERANLVRLMRIKEIVRK